MIEMEQIFLGLFVGGFAFMLLSFLLGFAQAHPHLPGGAHLPHLHLPGMPHGHGGHGGGRGSDLSVVNPSTAATFVTWFGGVGLLLTRLEGYAPWVVVALATVAGIGGAGIVGVVLVRYLLPGQTPYMLDDDYRIEGTLARVTLPLGPDRTGEVMFVRNGATCSEVARSADGAVLARGAEVVILGHERGIAYVQGLDKLIEERGVRPTALDEPDEGRLTE